MAISVVACNSVNYTVEDDGRVLLGGELISYDKSNANYPIAEKVWKTWGALIRKHAARAGIPAIWAAGIMCQESGGNPAACSPCDPRVCSFAPNCGGPCCAYGLMQFIKQTAKGYGVPDVEALRRDPELAISKGCDLIAHLKKVYNGDIVKIASAYNAGSHKCRYFGTFGNSAKSQGDYVGKIVKFSNTIHGFGAPSILPSVPGAGQVQLPVVALAAAAAAATMHLALKYRSQRRLAFL